VRAVHFDPFSGRQNHTPAGVR